MNLKGYGLLVPDGPFPFLSYFNAFATYEEACNHHDNCYDNAHISQVHCDKQFLVLKTPKNYFAIITQVATYPRHLRFKGLADGRMRARPIGGNLGYYNSPLKSSTRRKTMALTWYINKVTGYFTDKRVVEKTGNLKAGKSRQGSDVRRQDCEWL